MELNVSNAIQKKTTFNKVQSFYFNGLTVVFLIYYADGDGRLKCGLSDDYLSRYLSNVFKYNVLKE